MLVWKIIRNGSSGTTRNSVGSGNGFKFRPKAGTRKFFMKSTGLSMTEGRHARRVWKEDTGSHLARFISKITCFRAKFVSLRSTK